MAYQFVNADQLNADLTSVANAIRSKSKTEVKLLFPGGMVNAISAISTGAEMNFQVVGSMDQPSDPEENMIWICTDFMFDWYFQPEQPENMLPGDVWIITGTTSPVAFSVLKKNTVMVCPISAKLMGDDGVLVDVTAKSWQNGEWVEWVKYIFKDGSGWVLDCGYTLAGGCVVNTSEIICANVSNGGKSGFVTDNSVDFSGGKTLHFEVKNGGGSNAHGLYVGFGNNVVDWPTDNWTAYVLVQQTYADWTPLTLDISAIPSGLYFKAFNYNSPSASIRNIYVE